MLDPQTQLRLDTCFSKLTPRSIFPQLSSGTTVCPACNYREATSYPTGVKCWRPSCSFNKYHNLIDLVRYRENLSGKGSFYKALEILENLAGINLKKSLNALQERSLSLNKALTLYQYYLGQPCGSRALEYLYSRGFTKESILEHQVGFAPNTNSLAPLNEQDRKELRRQGLISSENLDYYSNRIIFPIKEKEGNLVHFTGRYLGNIPQNLYPRYKDTMGVEGVFNIKRYLVFEDYLNFYSKESLLIAEGFPDALILHQEGFQSCGLLGLEQLQSQYSKLEAFKEVVFIFDNDKFELDHPTLPNQYKSWSRIIPQIINLQIQLPSLTFYVWMVPEDSGCKDINEWRLTVTSEVFKKSILNSKLELVSYLVDNWGSQKSKHLDLIKLIALTGKGEKKMNNYISPDFNTLDYCVSLFK